MDISCGNKNGGGGGGSSRLWTNEQHVHFLNSIEATFVRSMFERFDVTALPLDRQMPDSQESTLDLGKERRSHRYSTSDAAECSRGRTDKNNKRSTLSSDSSYHRDQVVPQIESGDEGETKTTNPFHQDGDKYQTQYHLSEF